jgi:hypothetical protein
VPPAASALARLALRTSPAIPRTSAIAATWRSAPAASEPVEPAISAIAASMSPVVAATRSEPEVRLREPSAMSRSSAAVPARIAS